MSLQTIPALPVAISLTGGEEVWINQGGTDRRTTTGAIANLGSGSSQAQTILVSTSGTTLLPGNFYIVQSDLGAFTALLPALGDIGPPVYLEVADGDDNAGINNFTVNAAPGDSVLDHETVGSSYVININNTITRFMGLPTGWRVITYGA